MCQECVEHNGWLEPEEVIKARSFNNPAPLSCYLRPDFTACNHGCRARKAEGMATNGGCDLPRLADLEEQAMLMWGCHDDKEVRKFSRKVVSLLRHIKIVEFDR